MPPSFRPNRSRRCVFGIFTLFTSLLLAPALTSQAGDHAGEEQAPLPDDLVVPEAPVLGVEEAAASFVLEPGFRIELVASEPLVEDPVQVVFDGDGRLWVCEMRGYMPDVDGNGEDAPNGVIAVLYDEDGDGRMDRREVFLDELVLPRAIAPAYDGALVLAPPELFFARDTDGDGRADERTVIDTGLAGRVNPEHAINGLLFTLDNWFWCANAGVRYRRVDGEWVKQRTAGGGQWGIAQDDEGRIVFNTNSDPLRGDLYPSHYAVRNPNLGRASGVNVRLAANLETWPVRMTPGVNRGYQEATLRDDYTLARFTAACGPLIYRGDAFPKGHRGNAFVCETVGNLVKRYVVEATSELAWKASLPYEGREFLASTDERFRPVNLANGPDGALYVVDFYRGVVQHRTYVTSFLRRQIVERRLETPLGHGRIWRVLPDAPGERERVAPRLGTATWTELVQALSHPNGWWRDTAQRLIVEDGPGERDALELLRERLDPSSEQGRAPTDADRRALGRQHALFALAGIGGLRVELAQKLMRDPDPRVRRAALRTGEVFLGMGNESLLADFVSLGRSAEERTRFQVLLSLGEAQSQAADRALAQLIATDASSGEARSALVSGLGGRELAFLRNLVVDEDWRDDAPGRSELFALLVRAIVREGRGDRMEELVGLWLESSVAWQRESIERALIAARPKNGQGEPRPIRLGAEPARWAELAARFPDARNAVPGAERDVAAEATLLSAFTWPGRPGAIEDEPLRALTEEESRRFERGRALYAETCASCHQPSGLGDPGKAPPLRHSPAVLGPDDRLARIVLHGLVGRVEREGFVWDLDMPAHAMNDADTASVLTYVRREWGHAAEPIDAQAVRASRERFEDRSRPWTRVELGLDK